MNRCKGKKKGKKRAAVLPRWLRPVGLGLLVGLWVLLMCGCSGATFSEEYVKSPAMASHRGQGQASYRMVYKGKLYTLARQPDGRLRAQEVQP